MSKKEQHSALNDFENELTDEQKKAATDELAEKIKRAQKNGYKGDPGENAKDEATAERIRSGFYVVELSGKTFDRSTGRPEIKPFSQMIGLKQFKSSYRKEVNKKNKELINHFDRIGYTVKILWDPTEYNK